MSYERPIGRVFRGPTPSSRWYFFDVDTGEELPFAECASMGTAESGIWNRRRYKDTSLAVFGIDLTTRIYTEITAATFPGRRVAAKEWYPGTDGKPHHEWMALVDRGRGWQGNEVNTMDLERREIGIARIMREKLATLEKQKGKRAGKPRRPAREERAA